MTTCCFNYLTALKWYNHFPFWLHPPPPFNTSIFTSLINHEISLANKCPLTHFWQIKENKGSKILKRKEESTNSVFDFIWYIYFSIYHMSSLETIHINISPVLGRGVFLMCNSWFVCVFCHPHPFVTMFITFHGIIISPPPIPLLSVGK